MHVMQYYSTINVSFMNENEQIRSMLTQLRERAELSQAEVAEKVKFTASPVSRL